MALDAFVFAGLSKADALRIRDQEDRGYSSKGASKGKGSRKGYDSYEARASLP